MDQNPDLIASKMQQTFDVCGDKWFKEAADLIRTQAAALDRYRYVYNWWASDSYDRGGEFNSRMNWARGEDIHHDLTPNELAEIGQRFLIETGRTARIAAGFVAYSPNDDTA